MLLLTVVSDLCRETGTNTVQVGLGAAHPHHAPAGMLRGTPVLRALLPRRFEPVHDALRSDHAHEQKVCVGARVLGQRVAARGVVGAPCWPGTSIEERLDPATASANVAHTCS